MAEIVKFLKRYNELWLGPIGLLLYFMSAPLVRAMDPEAVAYTSDALQKVIFGHLVFSACIFSAWLSLRLTWPNVFKYLTDHFDNEFSNQKNKSQCVKPYLSFCLLALYLLGLIASMHVL